MNPETVSTITTWLGLITLTIAAVGSIIIIAIAVTQSLKSRVVRWDALIFAAVLLWVLPYGIRIYGPELVDATIDLLNNLAGKREPMEDALTRFIGTESVIAPEPTMPPSMPEFTSTPEPTRSIDFEATATVFFENLPTATNTPFPNYAATIQAQVTPTATVFVCRQSSDIAKGCLPPTPQPGN